MLILVLSLTALGAFALSHTAAMKARAETALTTRMPAREAQLARGFILGEADEIDHTTTEDFRRSGLAHLLAVSGQNVALLGLLAMPLLAALGIPLRARLLWVLFLIAVYVPLAGAGASIQRAAIMGALTLIATLAGRPASRFYALAVAAVVTLAINPRFAGDVGWQLSFAAVLGILLLIGPLRATLAVGRDGPWSRAARDGVAMTTAATLATAPLMAFHFGGISTTTVVANLLALPAVAPAMWLGMLGAAAGQLPGAPVAILNAVEAPLLAYIAQVAAWFGRPRWAYLHVRMGAPGLVASYTLIAMTVFALLRLARRRRLAAARRRPELRWTSSHRLPVAGVLLAAVLLLAARAWAVAPSHGASGAPAAGLRVSVLDVGQGDSILLQPLGASPILVDGGPAGDGLTSRLEGAGVARLGAVVLTHAQADHAGGLEEILGEIPIDRLFLASPDRQVLGEAGLSGVPATQLAAGSRVCSGRLCLEVLWPPPELLDAASKGQEQVPEADGNRLSLVMVARWRSFSMLLTGDAEAGSTRLEPGPVDVLKVAHHGSEDPGLPRLLDQVRPALAVISVGAGNPFGHPASSTLEALASHGVRTVRTDLDGTIVLDVRRQSITTTFAAVPQG